MPQVSRRGEVLSTYVAPDIANALRAQAGAADRTIAAELRRAVRIYLLYEDDDRGAGTTSREVSV